MKNITMLKGKKIVNKENGAVRLVVDVNEEFNKLYVIPTDKDAAAPVPMAYASFTRRWEVLEESAPEVLTPDEPVEATEPKTETPKADKSAKATKAPKTKKPVKTPEVEEEPETTIADEPETVPPTTTTDTLPTPTTTHPEGGAAMKMSDVVSKLESLFDLLNRAYFEDALPRPVITVQSTPKAYGHCSTKKIWKSDNAASYEINIGAEYLNRPSANTASTMCHEMVHLYCLENKISDTCQHGRYHNKTFKEEAEKRDLEVGYDRANGYTHTAPTDNFKKTLEDNGFTLDVLFARVPPKERAKAERTKAHTYICPCCGQKVKTTSDLSLICGLCEEPMGRVD